MNRWDVLYALCDGATDDYHVMSVETETEAQAVAQVQDYCNAMAQSDGVLRLVIASGPTGSLDGILNRVTPQ